MKIIKSLISVTAMALIAVPVAAQAGTTASASTGKIASLPGFGERKSARVKPKQNLFAGVAAPILFLGGAGLVAVTYVAVDAIADDKSNGS